MSIWSLAAAVALTGATVGLHQEKAVEPTRRDLAPAVEVTSQKRVSVSFTQASAKDVLDWLSKNGGNFVLADSEVPKDLSLTMNIQDQPMDEVMDAVAEALGGHWEQRGGIRVFRTGPGFMVMRGMAPGAMRAWAGPDMKEFRVPMPKDFMPDMKEFAVPDMKEFQGLEKLKELKELKEMPQMRIEIRKQVEDAMRGAHEEMRKAHEEMQRAHGEMERSLKEDGEGGFLFVAPGDKQVRILKEGKALPKRTIHVGGGQDVSKLFTSLSQKQRELNKRQGYLKLSDLRAEQLKMLGLSANTKDVTITIVRNGEKLTIKGD